MALFTENCSVKGGTGDSGAISPERRSGLELGLYSKIGRTGKEGDGMPSPSYSNIRLVMHDQNPRTSEVIC
jgi:hypothetical protein